MSNIRLAVICFSICGSIFYITQLAAWGGATYMAWVKAEKFQEFYHSFRPKTGWLWSRLFYFEGAKERWFIRMYTTFAFLVLLILGIIIGYLVLL